MFLRHLIAVFNHYQVRNLKWKSTYFIQILRSKFIKEGGKVINSLFHTIAHLITHTHNVVNSNTIAHLPCYTHPHFAPCYTHNHSIKLPLSWHTNTYTTTLHTLPLTFNSYIQYVTSNSVLYSTLYYLYTLFTSTIYCTQSITHPLITLCTTLCCFTSYLSNYLRPFTVQFKHYKSRHIFSAKSVSVLV